MPIAPAAKGTSPSPSPSPSHRTTPRPSLPHPCKYHIPSTPPPSPPSRQSTKLTLHTTGIIIVGGVVIAASVALYQNEQVQEWLQRTGQKVTEFWEEVVHFEQRQMERRRGAAMGYGAGSRSSGRAAAANTTTRERVERERNGQPGSVEEEERKRERRLEKKQARRTLWEGAGAVVGGVATTQQEIVDGSGVRRRKAREASKSEEALLGVDAGAGATSAVAAADAAEEEEVKQEVLFDRDIQTTSLLDQADSVLDLVPEGIEGTGVWKSGERADGVGVGLTTVGETAHVSALLPPDVELARTAEDMSLLDQHTQALAVPTHGETAFDAIDTTTTNTADPQIHVQIRPISPSNILASSHLTLSLPTGPTNPTNPFEDSSYHTPTTLSTSHPHSPSFVSTSGTASPVDIHTPPEDDEEFETISEAGTETASHLSLGSGLGEVDERLRRARETWDEEGEEDGGSVASSGISGWSDVGGER